MFITKNEAEQEYKAGLISSDFNDIWHLKTKVDRVKFCRYLFTGCIFVDEKKIVCGNKTMFADVCGTTKEPGELFFKAIDLTANGLHQSGHKADSLFDTITRVTHKTIQEFRSFVHTEKIVCILQQKVVDPINGSEFADTIKALKPYSIDWSNVPDYFEKNSFIRFAEACSVEDTLHTVHFINWVECVFGAGHVDWKHCQDLCLTLCQMAKTESNSGFQTLASRCTDSILSFFESAPYIDTLNDINMFPAIRYQRRFEDFFLSDEQGNCLLYTSPSPRDGLLSRMPSSA